MFSYRKLDNQSYDDIVSSNGERIALLTPSWTNHNAADPGITILELLSWYKEMQQYHLDQTTDEMYSQMIGLLGIVQNGCRGAECRIELPDDGFKYTVGSRLENGQGVVFELSEEVPERRVGISAIVIEGENGSLDLTDMQKEGMVFTPFDFENQKGILKIGFSEKPAENFSLWFDIDEPEGVRRNAPDSFCEKPRIISWTQEGYGGFEPVRDGTWAFSFSGFVEIEPKDSWKPDGDGIYWIRISEEYPGCEERVRLRKIRSNIFNASQRETRVKSHRFRLRPEREATVSLTDAQAMDSTLSVFVRTGDGMRQSDDFKEKRDAHGLTIRLDASDASQDGKDNVLVVCTGRGYEMRYVFSTRGRPAERLYLPLEGQGILDGGISILCDTLCDDGVVRVASWQRTDDLMLKGPSDRVFEYDEDSEEIVFGDGFHGQIPWAGEGSVMISDLVLTRGTLGNVPKDCGLKFTANDTKVMNHAASGGRDREGLKEARLNLLKRLHDSRKCVTASDYEAAAMNTPGLRVAGAKAIAGSKFISGSILKKDALLGVVVLPASEDERPMPDENFLRAVERQLNLHRMICIEVKALPPRYVPVLMELSIVANHGVREDDIVNAVRGVFSAESANIGKVAKKSEIMGIVQRIPGVLRLNSFEMNVPDSGGYLSEAGDVIPRPDGLIYISGISCDIVEG